MATVSVATTMNPDLSATFGERVDEAPLHEEGQVVNDAFLDDLQYRLLIESALRRSLDEAERGETLTMEEVFGALDTRLGWK